jgi:DNA-binding SARP family transcriptional activator/TolB-like protein
MFRLRLFGGFLIEGGSNPLGRRAAQKKRIALLPLLVAAPTARVSRDRLIGLLWPELDTERARHQLASTVYELRKSLGGAAILSVGDDLQINGEVVWSDVAAFAAATAHSEWARATDLYRGAFLDGFFLDDTLPFERWVDAERARLASLYAEGLKALAEHAATRGDVDGAVTAWRRLAAHEPYDSRHAVRLMQALQEAGDRVGALQHGQQHEALLRRDLALDPDPRVTTAIELLRAEFAAGHAAAPLFPVRPGDRAAPGGPRPRAALPTHSRPAVPSDRTTATPHGAGRARAGAAAGLLMLVSAVALSAPEVLSRVGAGATSSASVPAPEVSAPQSIAVLPFTDLSPGQSHQYLGDGLADEVITTLAQTEGLRVAAWTSVVGFRDHVLAPREVARRLDVQHLLEGSVRRNGTRVRITVRLVDPEAGFPRWSRTFDRELSDVFAIQQDIASAIVAALGMELQRPAGTPAGTRDLYAHDLYLQGRYQWHLASVADSTTQERALAFYLRAAERDPEFAAAYAGMADAYSHANDPRLARASALKAVALDSTLAAGYTALAYVSAFFDWNWSDAERQLDRALELNPSYVLTYLRRANVLSALGRSEEAVAVVERAVQMEPASFLVRYNRGLVHYWAGRYDDAVRFLAETLEMDTTRTDVRRELAHALYGRGDFAAAATLYRSVGDTIFATLATGSRDELASLLQRVEANGTELPPTTIANLYARLGMRDHAFAALEDAVKNRDRWVPFQLRFPGLAPLESDPRFAALRGQVGLR